MHWPQEHVVGTSVGLLIAGLRALSPLPDAVRGAILTEVSDGAWVSLQAQSASTAPTTLDDYFAQITNKTGAIMAATAWAGARIHCEDEGLLDQAYTFGAELGILSQLRNDLADFADPSRIAERASLWSSLPILYAHTLTAHPRQPQFKALLASRDTLDPARFTAFRELLIDMGALDYCTSVYAYHVDRAIKALSTWPATPYREALIAQVMPGKVEVRRKSP
jgi:geranylgeranyl pyrophosphate synthase